MSEDTIEEQEEVATIEEVDEYYEVNHNNLVKYTCNALEGGDRLQMEEEDAEDLVMDLYVYHRENPEQFSEQWIWNSLQQRRSNFHRDGKTDKKHDASINQYLLEQEEIYEEYSERDDAMKETIKSEIMAIDDMVKREVLIRHYLMGEGVVGTVNIVEGSNHKMITRFRDKMVKKYGDVHE